MILTKNQVLTKNLLGLTPTKGPGLETFRRMGVLLPSMTPEQIPRMKSSLGHSDF